MITEIDGVQYQAQQAKDLCDGCAADTCEDLDVGQKLCERLPPCCRESITEDKWPSLQAVSQGKDIIWVEVSP